MLRQPNNQQKKEATVLLRLEERRQDLQLPEPGSQGGSVQPELQLSEEGVMRDAQPMHRERGQNTQLFSSHLSQAVADTTL